VGLDRCQVLISLIGMCLLLGRMGSDFRIPRIPLFGPMRRTIWFTQQGVGCIRMLIRAVVT
jgi:hypothetical protein